MEKTLVLRATKVEKASNYVNIKGEWYKIEFEGEPKLLITPNSINTINQQMAMRGTDELAERIEKYLKNFERHPTVYEILYKVMN